MDEAIKLDIGSSSEQFILGGFPYAAEFKVSDHDGSPREEDIEICVRLFKDIKEIKRIDDTYLLGCQKQAGRNSLQGSTMW